MNDKKDTPQEALRRAVTGKVEAGEAQPIVEVRAPEAGPPPGHVQQPGTVWTPSDPQQKVAPAKGTATVTPIRRAPGLGKGRESLYATIVVTAAEGFDGVEGVTRWAELDRYAWWAHDLEGGLAKPAPDGGDNAAAFLVVKGDTKRKKHYVDLHCIDHAFVTLAAGEVKGLPEVDRARFLDVRSRVLRDDPEPDAADELGAYDCDRIAQVGLFDEVRYGA